MRKIREKKRREKVEKILSGCYHLHQNQRSTRELVLRCRKRSMIASAEGWPKTKALYPERRRWRRPQHCTKSRARRPSWRVLFDAWRRWPPRTFSSRFFLFLSSVFSCSVCSTLGEGDLQGPFLLDFFYFYLLSSHALFFHHICVCWRHALFFHLVFAIIEVDFDNECFLMAWLLFYIDKKQYSKRFSKS